jgi:hypothetical protein
MALNFAKINLGMNFKPQTVTPTNPSNGDVYYDSTRNTLVHYVNGNWSDVQSRSDVASATTMTSTNFTASIVQSSLIRITGSTAGTIAGLTASSDGKFVVIYNESTALMTIANNSGSEGAAANRILTPSGVPITLTAGQSVLMTYDGSQSNWIALASSSSSSGSGSGKNYLSSIVTSQSSTPNTGNGNFELGSTTGWDWCNVGTLTNGIPTGSPNFASTTSGSVNLYTFTITTSTTAVVGDTYTNNGATFTLVSALAAQSGAVFFATSTGTPLTSGTLTRSFGAGTASITYTSNTYESASIVNGALASSYSMQLFASAATTVGLGFCSDAFYIDASDQAKVLTWKFNYKAVSGSSNVNWSGTSSNSFAVAFYDVVNSSWLYGSSGFGMTQSSGVGYATGTFQTNLTTTQIRMVVYNANATAGGTDLYFDDFTVGPQTAPLGVPATDWKSFTLTIGGVSGTPTPGTNTQAAYSRRVGDSLEIRYFLSQTAAGSNGTGAYKFPLPAGYVIDTTKAAVTTNANGQGGTAVGYGSGANTASNAAQTATPLIVYAYDTTNLTLIGMNTASPAQLEQVGSGFLNLSNTTILYSFTAIVPIVGWSANVQMSNDTDTRVIDARMTGATATVTSSYSDVTWSTIVTDRAGAMGATTYTIPISGDYDFDGQLYMSATTIAAGNSVTVSLNSAGSTLLEQTYVYQGTNTTSVSIPFSFHKIALTAGTAVKIQVKSTTTAPVITASATENFFSIGRISGPSVNALTESVNGRYFSSASTITSSLATITYATKTRDSHSAYSGGTWTCPTTGMYLFTAGIATSGTVALNTTLDLQIVQAGSASQTSEQIVYAGGVETNLAANVCDEFYCLAGDTITVKVASSATTPTIVASNNRNFFSWSRIGN